MLNKTLESPESIAQIKNWVLWYHSSAKQAFQDKRKKCAVFEAVSVATAFGLVDHALPITFSVKYINKADHCHATSLKF